MGIVVKIIIRTLYKLHFLLHITRIIQTFDTMHLACAENNADIMLTNDDRFIKKAKRLNGLKIEINNPLKWLNEVL